MPKWERGFDIWDGGMARGGLGEREEQEGMCGPPMCVWAPRFNTILPNQEQRPTFSMIYDDDDNNGRLKSQTLHRLFLSFPFFYTRVARATCGEARRCMRAFTVGICICVYGRFEPE